MWSNLDELATKFPWIERGYYKRSYESYFQLALEEALNKQHLMPVQLNETLAEPWEPEAWHEQEMAIQRRLISTAKIVPREIAELEIQQMVHIGGGQYLKADDPPLVKREGATLTGQPSSSSARTSAVAPLPTITKQEIMSHTVFRAPTRQEIRRDETMHMEYQDVITCFREDDHVLAEMLRITGDLDSCPSQREAGDDIDDYGPDFISVVQNAPEYEHYDKTWLIGVISDQGIQAHPVAV